MQCFSVPLKSIPLKQQLKAGSVHPGFSRIPLQQLIDGLVGNSLPVAANRRSVVVNEVGRGVCLRTIHVQLISLLNDILSAVIANSFQGDIRISVQEEKKQLVLSITERNNYNGYALSYRIGALEREAGRMGLVLSMENPTRLETTIRLVFPGMAA